MRRYVTYITKEDFIASFCDAFKAAMITDNIKSGFAKAGLVPFDPNRVLSELEIPPVVPTPTVSPLTSAGSIRSPPTKTLRNIKEITRQGRYLQRKIGNY